MRPSKYFWVAARWNPDGNLALIWLTLFQSQHIFSYLFLYQASPSKVGIEWKFFSKVAFQIITIIIKSWIGNHFSIRCTAATLNGVIFSC